MKQKASIFVAGHRGLLGSALVRSLRAGGYNGGFIFFDSTKPDGTPRKLLDVTRIHDLGWRHRINLEDGGHSTYQWLRQYCAAEAARAMV